MLILSYLVVLGAGLGLPILSATQPTSFWWLALAVNLVAALALVFSAGVLMVFIAKYFFPEYWWLSQIKHEDIYEHEGVYFIGIRHSRQKSRLQKLLFGVDERMRPWDMLFGLAVLSLTVPHFLGGYLLYGVYQSKFSPPVALPQTMHSITLSTLPVMQDMRLEWRANEDVSSHINEALNSAKAKGGKSNDDLLLLAQLQLLSAFEIRKNHQDFFLYSPGETVFFNRGKASQAISYLERILTQPELERGDWSRGAYALEGLYHLSDMSPGKAQKAFDNALNAAGEGKKSGFARYQVVLLAAQAAMLDRDTARAENLLETILVDDRLPRRAYPLAVEHYAGVLHMRREGERVREMLEKARKLYSSQGNQAGLARVHLRLAALALEEGDTMEASHRLSAAAGNARAIEDGFTLNMVDSLSQRFSQH